MERSTALRKVKRGICAELGYRMNWIFFGIVGAILLAFIPIVGWFLAVGVILATLWKTFGFRETQVVGSCPACTKSMVIEPKSDVFACPVCQSCIAVREDSLVVLDIN